MKIIDEEENKSNNTATENQISKGLSVLAIITIVGGFILSYMTSSPVWIVSGLISALILQAFSEIIRLLQKLCNKADIIISNLSALNGKDNKI